MMKFLFKNKSCQFIYEYCRGILITERSCTCSFDDDLYLSFYLLSSLTSWPCDLDNVKEHTLSRFWDAFCLQLEVLGNKILTAFLTDIRLEVSVKLSNAVGNLKGK